VGFGSAEAIVGPGFRSAPGVVAPGCEGTNDSGLVQFLDNAGVGLAFMVPGRQIEGVFFASRRQPKPPKTSFRLVQRTAHVLRVLMGERSNKKHEANRC
jgi:hypothetical protein